MGCMSAVVHSKALGLAMCRGVKICSYWPRMQRKRRCNSGGSIFALSALNSRVGHRMSMICSCSSRERRFHLGLYDRCTHHARERFRLALTGWVAHPARLQALLCFMLSCQGKRNLKQCITDVQLRTICGFLDGTVKHGIVLRACWSYCSVLFCFL